MDDPTDFLHYDVQDDYRTSPWRLGKYVSYPCPNCHRSRVCECPNGKHKCEKCNWCPENKEYIL